MDSTLLSSGRPSKTQVVRERLIKLAHRAGPDGKLPRILDLRDALGVSLTTLNAVLSELETQNVIYRKHGVGIFVSPKLHHRAICLVCDPSFFRLAATSPFWQMLIESARERALAKNEDFSFHLAIPHGHGDAPFHEGLVGEIEGGRVQGVIGVGIDESGAAWMARQSVPFVAFAGPARCMVAIDSASIARQGAQSLIEQGCTRLAFWSPVAPYRSHEHEPSPVFADLECVPSDASVQAFRATLEKHGLPFELSLVRDNRHLIAGGAITKETHQEQGFRTAMEVFGKGKKNRSDGIFIADDVMAHGALIALQKLGIDPRNLCLATHINKGSNVLIGWEHELTRIEVDPAQVSRALFDTLETLMDGGKPKRELNFVPSRVIKACKP